MHILILAPHPFFVDRGTPMALDILLRALSEAVKVDWHSVCALLERWWWS